MARGNDDNRVDASILHDGASLYANYRHRPTFRRTNDPASSLTLPSLPSFFHIDFHSLWTRPSSGVSRTRFTFTRWTGIRNFLSLKLTLPRKKNWKKLPLSWSPWYLSRWESERYHFHDTSNQCHNHPLTFRIEILSQFFFKTFMMNKETIRQYFFPRMEIPWSLCSFSPFPFRYCLLQCIFWKLSMIESMEFFFLIT